MTANRVVSLYGGKHVIEFDDNRHCYTLQETQAKPDGVTTILGLIPKFLTNWAGRVDVDYYHNQLIKWLKEEHLYYGGETLDRLQDLRDHAIKEHDRLKVKAGGIGTDVHAFAEHWFNTGEFPSVPHNAPHFMGCEGIKGWINQMGIDRDCIESERIIYHDRLFYAGTCDIFKFDGRPFVADIKTSSGFYEDQILQLAAYACALDEELGIEIPDGWILHVDKEKGKCTPYYVELTKELKTDWEAVRIAWRAVKRNQERHRQIKKGNGKCPTSANTIPAAVTNISKPPILATTEQ